MDTGKVCICYFVNDFIPVLLIKMLYNIFLHLCISVTLAGSINQSILSENVLTKVTDSSSTPKILIPFEVNKQTDFFKINISNNV